MPHERRVLLVSLIALFGLLAAVLAWSFVYQSQTHFLAGTTPDLPGKERPEPTAPPHRPTDPSRGSQDPKAVTILEFADYACLYCRVAEFELERVLKKESVPIRIVWRDLPITDEHPDSLMAASAARCANEQGKFWEMHDALMDAASFDLDNLKRLALPIGLNADVFNKCLSSGKHIAPIQEDVTLARAHGMTGTPTLFIGKRVLTGTITADDIAAAVRWAAR